MAEKYSLQGFCMERLATLDPTPPPIDNFPGIATQPAQAATTGWNNLLNTSEPGLA